MFEKQTVVIVGAVAGAVGVVLTILSRMYSLFASEISTMGAIVIAGMGAFLIALSILSLDNRIRMKKMLREEP